MIEIEKKYPNDKYNSNISFLAAIDTLANFRILLIEAD